MSKEDIRELAEDNILICGSLLMAFLNMPRKRGIPI